MKFININIVLHIAQKLSYNCIVTVNVTKNFTDMKQIERSNEREAFLLARKICEYSIIVQCCKAILKN